MAIEQRGIDVSSWQGEIDWGKVKADGIQFAMLRAAASTRLDRKFIQNIENATAKGIPCGVYLYSYADTTAEALSEAEFLLDAIRPYKLQYPVAYDIEDKVQHHLTNTQRTDMTETFCQRIAQEKYRPTVYTSLSWFNTMLDLSRLSDFDKWIAHWGVPKCGFNGPYQIWQNSSKGRVSGILGDVDMNIGYFDYSGTGSKPLPANATIVVNTPKNQGKLSAGVAVNLSGVPLFADSKSDKPVGRFSGQYWIYDGIPFGKKLRLTNQQRSVGKKPEAVNVTGYANIQDLKLP